MRKWFHKKLAKALCVCMTATLLVGCGSGATQGGKNDVLFQYAGQDVTLEEAWLYLKTMQSQYESYYGDGIWENKVTDEDGKETTLAEVTKKDTIKQIKMVKYMSSEAEKLKLTLTEEEKADIAMNAESFIESVSKEDLEQTGMTKEIVEKVFTENALASKFHDDLVKKEDISISDKESRQYKTYNLLFETFEYDEQGQKKEFDAKKKAKQKAKAEEALARIKKGEKDLAKLAEKYKADKSSEYTFGDDGTTAPEYAKAAMKLKKDEISGIVESEFGYHIIKMIDPDDKEASEQKKQELRQQKENEYFAEKYEELTKPLEEKWNFEKDVNQELYKKLTFKKVEPASTESTTEEKSEEASTESATETKK